MKIKYSPRQQKAHTYPITETPAVQLPSLIWQFLTHHWLALVLVLIGTWVRVYDLPNLAIVFPDAGRDLEVAATAVKSNTLPLQGIPSSVPRFKQGPLSIWLNMSLIHIAGYDLTVYSLVYAAIGIFALIGIYETCLVFFNRQAGLVALALLAFSPLAIAHSRMPYHTTPIPLFTIFYWWGLQALITKKSHGVFWAILTGWLLFQFELSMFPVLLAIPIIFYVQKISFKKHFSQIFTATLLGLLPQWLHDLTNRSFQLGEFAAWVGYRIASLFLPGQHTIGTAKLESIIHSFGTYVPRLWGVDLGWNNAIMLGITGVALYGLWQLGKPKLTSPLGILLLLTSLITAGYIAHGAPSEAYFPIYFILLPLLIGVGLAQLPTRLYLGGLIACICLGSINIHTIWRHNFFVSNSQAMSYGPSYHEQLLIAQTLLTLAQDKINITGPTGQTLFPSSFAHIQWALRVKATHDLRPIPTLVVSEQQRDTVRLVPSREAGLNFTGFHAINYQRRHFASQTLIWPTTNRYVKNN